MQSRISNNTDSITHTNASLNTYLKGSSNTNAANEFDVKTNAEQMKA